MFNSEEEPDSGIGTKSERTRALIRSIALASFRDRGYEETTLRLIAKEAGVSLGNAYYYFPTKNHLVQELYLDVTGGFHTSATAALVGVDDLIERLRIAYTTGLGVLEPFHGFAPGFLSASVSPRSPINPLSTDSEPARDEALAVFRLAVAGAKHSLPDDIAKALPDALMLGYLLLSLYWVYDASAGQERTHRLLERGLNLLKLALPLTRMPLLRRPIRELLDLVAEVRA